MNEEFKPKVLFAKDSDNLKMLSNSLESKEIDQEIVPVLNKFFSLPITPRESCYGHPEEDKSPYLSYVEDDVNIEKDKNFQKTFKEKIQELTDAINQRIGGEVVSINLEEIDRGGGPKDYTLRFEVVDKDEFKKTGKEIITIIWDEFSKYLDAIK